MGLVWVLAGRGGGIFGRGSRVVQLEAGLSRFYPSDVQTESVYWLIQILVELVNSRGGRENETLPGDSECKQVYQPAPWSDNRVGTETYR